MWQPSPGSTDPRRTTITQYNADGSVDTVTEGSVPYNASVSSPGSVMRTLLRWTRYVYDDLGQVTQVWKTLPDANSAPSSSNEYLAEQTSYDKNGNVLTTTLTITLDGSGDPDDVRVTTNVYDARNELTEMDEQDPDPGNGVTTDIPVWHYGYDLRGNQTSIVDPLGKTTTIGFDRMDRQKTTTLADPDGAGGLGQPLYNKAFDLEGRVSRDIDPLGNYVLYAYDTLENRYESVYKNSSATVISTSDMWTDEDGRVVGRVIDNSRWAYTYDNLGRTTREYQPDPDNAMPWGMTSYTDTGIARPYTIFTYDANFNRLTETNELGKVTTYAYDDLNQLLSRTDPDPDGAGSKTSPVTSYTYDVFGNRKSLTDPDGNTTSWTYDLWGKMLTEESPLSSVTQDREFEYDLLGNLTKRTDHLGNIISYQYDLLGRVVNEKWSTLASSTVATEIDYSYDPKDELLTAGEYVPGTPNTYISQYTYTYNNVGWLTSTELDQAGLVTTTLNNTYDLDGRRTVQKADFTISSVTTHDFQNEYGYDGKGRETSLKQTSQSGGNVVANKYIVFGYTQQDLFATIDRYANTSASNLVAHTDYSRDYLNRLLTLDHLKGSTHFATRTYTYEGASRVKTIDEVFSNSAWDENHTFTYDNDDQLTVASHSVQDDENYGYDDNGNRDGSQTHLGGTASSTVGDNNLISSDGVYNYTYSDEGQMLTKTNISTGDKQEFGWDHRSRLISVTFKNSSNVIQRKIEFQYDHNDDLIRRIDTPYTSGSPGTATNDFFVFDRGQIVLAFHKGTSGDAYLTNRYLWANETDHLLSDEQVTTLSSAGTVYWSLGDHLNSVIDLVTYNSGTDTTSVAKHRREDSFGNITFDSASGVVERFANTGVMFEESFGSTWNRKRWFDVQLGQWMSEDPIGFKSGTENLSEYVGNHPTYATDPSGLQSPRFRGRFFNPIGRIFVPKGDESNRYRGIGTYKFGSYAELQAFLKVLFGQQFGQNPWDRVVVRAGCVGLGPNVQ